MKAKPLPTPRSRRPYMMAVFLGTALSALSASKVEAAPVLAVNEQTITDISRYCTACWRNARLNPTCWNDCTQEVFQRLLERVAPQAWDEILQSDGEDRRELVRAIDAVKKRTQRSWRRTTTLIGDAPDGRDAADRVRNDDRELVRQASAELLSDRQQRILQLSFEGWSVQEVAEQLTLPPERVSDEKYKAVRKLREHLCRSGAA